MSNWGQASTQYDLTKTVKAVLRKLSELWDKPMDPEDAGNRSDDSLETDCRKDLRGPDEYLAYCN